MEESVRKIVENAFGNTLTHRMTNSTIDLVANATFLRYMQDVEFGFDMPGVVTRLQVVYREELDRETNGPQTQSLIISKTNFKQLL